EGLAGNDIIDGRGGIDLVRYDGALASVTVDLAAGTASGDASVGSDTLINIEGVRGSKFDDTLTGGNASNGTDATDSSTLEIFLGGAGNDSIDGGQGFDRVDYTTSTVGVNVDLGAGTASDGLGGTDTLLNIEGVRGSNFDDILTGSAAAFESFEGRQGNDQIDGLDGIDRVDYKYSSAGVTVNLATGIANDGYGGIDLLSNIENVRGSRDFNDSIVGSADNNFIEGLGGNDTIDGGDGNDIMDGGAGNDSLLGGNGNDIIAMGGGANTIVGGAGFDVADFDFQDGSGLGGVVASLSNSSGTGTVSGANGGITTMSGIEGLSGTEFNDTLTGDAGNNYI